MNEAFSGRAEHTMELLKLTIDQISAAGEKLGSTKAGEKLLCSLKNTMTDREAVNTKFLLFYLSSKCASDYSQEVGCITC